MATYKSALGETSSADLRLLELDVYGSSRLGVLSVDQKLADLPEPGTPIKTLEKGNKHFELVNLPMAIGIGNVLSVISDRLFSTQSTTLGKVARYTADTRAERSRSMVSSSDYFPFGMQMPSRKVDSGKYRYGFNGMEKETGITGSESHYDFGARIYDGRIGRWLAVDPKEIKYPCISPYSYVYNNPVIFVEKVGKDFILYIENNQDCLKISENIQGVVNGAFNGNVVIKLVEMAETPAKMNEVRATNGKFYTVTFEVSISDQKAIEAIKTEGKASPTPDEISNKKLEMKKIIESSVEYKTLQKSIKYDAVYQDSDKGTFTPLQAPSKNDPFKINFNNLGRINKVLPKLGFAIMIHELTEISVMTNYCCLFDVKEGGIDIVDQKKVGHEIGNNYAAKVMGVHSLKGEGAPVSGNDLHPQVFLFHSYSKSTFITVTTVTLDFETKDESLDINTSRVSVNEEYSQDIYTPEHKEIPDK